MSSTVLLAARNGGCALYEQGSDTWTQTCLLRALSRHLSGALGSFPALSPVGTTDPQWGPGFHWKELPPPKLFTLSFPTSLGFYLINTRE